MIETLLNDLRYGAKMLWKSKGVTIVAVISLAVGIGANSAIFSLVNSILLRPRAVSQPEQLVEALRRRRDSLITALHIPAISSCAIATKFSPVSLLMAFANSNSAAPNEVEQIWGEAVSGNYFDVLGVQPHKGRTFAPEEDLVPGRNPVAVISYGLWQRRFNSDPTLSANRHH